MKIFLRYVGNLTFQRGVEEDIGVHQTSDSKVGMQLCLTVDTPFFNFCIQLFAPHSNKITHILTKTVLKENALFIQVNIGQKTPTLLWHLKFLN